ncbi:hypothetical protein DFH09DRAFT_1107152 [Mycena vulgaris]|nr:hypothetical protein DFH09DRAFT_1107152 [Mycena vulgaris]
MCDCVDIIVVEYAAMKPRAYHGGIVRRRVTLREGGEEGRRTGRLGAVAREMVVSSPQLRKVESASDALKLDIGGVPNKKLKIVEVLRESELFQTDLISACKRQRAYKSRVEESEVALAEEQTRTRDVERALRDVRVLRGISRGRGIDGGDGETAVASVGAGAETPKPRAVEDTAIETESQTPKFKSRAIDPPSDTSSPTRALKRRRLSSPTSPEPEPPRNFRDLKRDIQAFPQRTSRAFSSRNRVHADAGEDQSMTRSDVQGPARPGNPGLRRPGPQISQARAPARMQGLKPGAWAWARAEGGIL